MAAWTVASLLYNGVNLLPIKKGPYLTFDCVLNDGNSASLMGKAFNEGYALWMFDDMCRAFGIDSRDIPTCLREHVAHIIADQ